ncbi:MAG: ABC transporter permease, partial [Chloroflexi bacterium]|nr:ABC transporter permease [Chloroflexota bacterium]
MAQATAQPINLKAAPLGVELTRKPRSLWSNAWRQFQHHRLAMVGLVVLIGLLLGTIAGPLVYTQRIDIVDFGSSMLSPSAAHPFGTDDIGRDMLARALWGGRISLAVGVTSVIVSILLGTAVGAISGYFGKVVD